jgi:murein DD-endopeptidase MepM/ murein hydrolase activator NlpD
MKARVLHVILVGALAAGVVCALTLPASASLQTVTVRLTDGSLVNVTVDVPPGTPIEDIDLPGVPVPTPPSNKPSPKQPSSKEPSSEKAPTTRKKHKQRRSRSKRHAKQEQELVDEIGQRSPRKRHRRHRTKLRNADGSPTSANPTFFDALPGPSYARGVPNFVIRKFRVPIFLLSIYQAAGTQFGVNWETLAAINEIETDYGRNLNVSSAGAVGWMQFLPSTWRRYGVDANRDGRKDPYNPVDAIFAAARYLKAAGYQKSIRRAIFAYNHADWYVDSVLLRARLIRGVPTDVVGSLTGLTEGRFPVYARARYADDISEREAELRVKRGHNAARVVGGRDNRRGIEIYSRRGAPVVATNDGVVKKIGSSKRLGRFLVLQDVYGNRFTYGHLDSVSRSYPVPKDQAGNVKTDVRPISARDAKPTKAATAGHQLDDSDSRRVHTKSRPAATAPRASMAFKERLFAHPRRPNSKLAGGLEQALNSKQALRGFTTFRNYFSKAFGLDSKDVRLKELKKGSHVIGGTILGRIGKTTAKSPHLYFEIRPAGRGAPRIDPKPILDGWKLLEATAVYRASGRNALYGDDADKFSVGQVFLLPKTLLAKRVLSDPRIEVYPGGRHDVKTGQIDVRVLRTLEYLAERGLRPTVTSLKSGHSIYTKSGNISEHSSGNAVDIAKVNGVPILGHQDKGGITEQTIRALLFLQGTNRPHQIISLMDMGGPTFVMGDHDDHIHVGFSPLFGENKKLGKQTLAILKPGQWNDLIGRLRKIDNPIVRTKPSKYAIPVKKSKRRSSRAHLGE